MIVYTIVTLWLIGTVVTSAIIMEKTKPCLPNTTKLNIASIAWPITICVWIVNYFCHKVSE